MKVFSSLTKVRENLVNQEALARQQKMEIELLKDRLKTFDIDLASVMKKLASVKVENASLRWSRNNVDEKFMALGKDMNMALTAVADSSQQSVSHIAHLVESAFFEH